MTLFYLYLLAQALSTTPEYQCAREALEKPYLIGIEVPECARVLMEGEGA